jgi:hypothetical protein
VAKDNEMKRSEALNDLQKLGGGYMDIADYVGKPVVVQIQDISNFQFATLLGWNQFGIFLSAKGFGKFYNNREEQLYSRKFFPWSKIESIDFESQQLLKSATTAA